MSNARDLADIASGVTATPTELNAMDGITSTTAELNILDGVTATASELNYNDVTTPGTAQASKAVVLDSSKDIRTIHNIIQVEQTITFQSVANNGTSGTSKNINWGNGQKHYVQMTGNCTFTFTAPDGPGNFMLNLTQDATGGRTATWPATVKWPGGTAPTLTATASAVDIIAFYYDGTNYYGQASLDFS